jgi:hypothetical protein
VDMGGRAVLFQLVLPEEYGVLDADETDLCGAMEPRPHSMAST